MGQITDDRADRLLEDSLVLWLPSSPSWLAVTLVVLQFPGHVSHQRLRIWAAGRSPGVEEAVTAQNASSYNADRALYRHVPQNDPTAVGVLDKQILMTLAEATTPIDARKTPKNER